MPPYPVVFIHIFKPTWIIDRANRLCIMVIIELSASCINVYSDVIDAVGEIMEVEVDFVIKAFGEVIVIDRFAVFGEVSEDTMMIENVIGNGFLYEHGE